LNRPRWGDRGFPELFLGLLAVAIAAVITGIVVAHAIRDVKKRRDTLSVTGSARVPIEADLGRWRFSIRAQRADPAAAASELRREVRSVRAFLRGGGMTGTAVREPPLVTAQVSRRVGRRRFVTEYRITQRFEVTTPDVDGLERVAGNVSDLLAQGLPVAIGSISYVSTQLDQARIDALEAATTNARDRAKTIVDGLDGTLGPVRSAQLGVYQIVPRNSTAVADIGINDTTTREKDVIAVVTVTFAVS
jgi:hypothetical protein